MAERENFVSAIIDEIGEAVEDGLETAQTYALKLRELPVIKLPLRVAQVMLLKPFQDAGVGLVDSLLEPLRFSKGLYLRYGSRSLPFSSLPLMAPVALGAGGFIASTDLLSAGLLFGGMWLFEGAILTSLRSRDLRI